MRLLLVLGLATAAVEIALRLVRLVKRGDPLGTPWRMPSAKLLSFESHPYCLYVKKPGSDGLYPSNSLGYTGKREFARARGANSVRLYCVGGSTAEGHDPARGPDSSWPGQLQDLLSVRVPGTTIECINASAAGYTSAESLVEFLFRGLDLQPDILLVYHNVNDAWSSQMVEGFTSDYSHARRHKPWSPGLMNRLPQLPWIGSYQLVRDWLTRRFGKANALLYWISDPPWNTAPSFDSHMVEAFERNVTNLVSVAKTGGCAPVLIQWECDWSARHLPPYHERTERATALYFQLLRANNDALQRVAARFDGCTYLDVGPFAPSQFSDTIHFSPEGLSEMARRVADGIESLVRSVIEGRRAGQSRPVGVMRNSTNEEDGGWPRS